MKRGYTLIELLVAVIMAAVLTAGMTTAYVTAIGYSSRNEQVREVENARIRFEERLRALLASAQVTTDATDRASYFIAVAGSGGVQGATGATADTMVFTYSGVKLPAAYLNSTEDFETLNERFGPQGGITEAALGLTSVAGSTRQGLFLREQRPADGDATQGGFESVLNEEVEEIGFEFFDGVNWVGTWDTTVGQRRLPAAVRVSYRLRDDDQTRTILVHMPLSDVTADNPYVADLGAGGGA